MIDTEPMVDELAKGLSHRALDGYEVYALSSSGLTVEIKNGAVDVFARRESAGLSVRVLSRGRLGFAFSTLLSPQAVPDLIDRVVAGAEVADPDPFWGFPEASSEPIPEFAQFDDSLKAVSLGEKIDRARWLEAAARTSDTRITKVRKAAYVENTGYVTICNHKGVKLTYGKTLISGSIMVVAEDGGNAEMGWDYGFSPFLGRLQMDLIGKAAAERALSQLGARPIRSMNISALFPPWTASELLSVLSSSFMADNLQKGKSLLLGKKGKQVFSSSVNILDDGLYPGGIGSGPVDDEGTLRKRNILVSGGLVKGFLYDHYTANKENTRSTGNASKRDIKGPPSVQATNFFIEKGAQNPDTLLSSLGEGLVVTDLIGLHTADPISGDFSFGASGLWVEDGEIRFPVKGVAIAGNLIQLFRDVDGVGSDLKFYGPFGSPSLRVSSLSVAGING